MERMRAEGFIVHAYRDPKRDAIDIVGRLVDGRSFVAAVPMSQPVLCIEESDVPRAKILLAGRYPSSVFSRSALMSFDGASLAEMSLPDRRTHEQTVSLLMKNAIRCHGSEMKDVTSFFVRRGIRGGVLLEGVWRQGKTVGVVFPAPEIRAAHDVRAPLTVLSVDIETSEPAGSIRVIGLSLAEKSGTERRRKVLFNGIWSASGPDPDPETEVFSGEKDLLLAFTSAVREFDPDIVTGWNILDFDFPRLAAAYDRNGLPFSLGRSAEGGKFFPSEIREGDAVSRAKRSASVFLPGRQVLDGLRLVRTGWDSYESYSLDSVAKAVLGSGKTVSVTDSEKLAELDRLYAQAPRELCGYCLKDADLVLDILEKKNILEYTVERAALTGAGIDKAWTSVASFERVYASGLFARGRLEPALDGSRPVSGAAGGTVLSPMAGLFRDVCVFDFRSLYPSIIRTFNIDPLAHEMTRGHAKASGDFLAAPNGALFTRDRGVLPELIDEYFKARLDALSRGDDGAAFVYKILMNSFYGVLGTPTCRYARTELAGAITSFGKMCLLFARDFFVARGFRVLYGDTDSVFVEMSNTGSGAADCEALAAGLNGALASYISEEYRCQSFIGIRFEKKYLRFLIPRLRSAEENVEHGRAKGYAGLLRNGDGTSEVEIKGMEAARSDYTPFTHRFQRELLDLLFNGDDTSAAERYIKDQAIALYRGAFDQELVFRKKLRRDPESYTASTPPHIKVARSLGWTRRRGTVEYLMTVNGPEALSLLRSRVDYGWYVASQLLPVARSAGLVSGFDADAIVGSVDANGQLEFSWDRDSSPP